MHVNQTLANNKISPSRIISIAFFRAHNRRNQFHSQQCQKYNQKSNFEFYCCSRWVRFTGHNNHISSWKKSGSNNAHITKRSMCWLLHERKKYLHFIASTKILSSHNNNQTSEIFQLKLMTNYCVRYRQQIHTHTHLFTSYHWNYSPAVFVLIIY